MANYIIKTDETTGEGVLLHAGGMVLGQDSYFKKRIKKNAGPYDQIRKYIDEVYVCEPNTAFVWGKDIVTGKYLFTGERWFRSGDFMYIMRKQDGKWGHGAFGMAIVDSD